MPGLTVQDNELLVWDPQKTQLQVKLGELVQYFQVSIPNNDGLPRAYIDPTQLSPHLLEIDTPDDVSDELVAQAKVAIYFDDGIPTVDGVPFWERLEGEPMPYYKMFKEYREMKYTKLEGSFTRSISQLSESTGMSGRQINAMAKVYHWALRCKAYDKYKDIEKQIVRQRTAEELELKHAKISNQLLDQAVTYLSTHPEQLSPKVAVDLAGLAMKAGRISVGLYPERPGQSASAGEGSRAPQFNIINQNTNVGEGGSASSMAMQDGMSDVERKTQENSKDVTHLQSILHVLNQSGAFAAATAAVQEPEGDEEDDIIDVDYESVDEE